MSATKRKPSPSARLNCVWLPLANAPIKARTRLGLVSEKPGACIRRRTRASVAASGNCACNVSHLSRTSGSSPIARVKARERAAPARARPRGSSVDERRQLVGHVVGLGELAAGRVDRLAIALRRRRGRARHCAARAGRLPPRPANRAPTIARRAMSREQGRAEALGDRAAQCASRAHGSHPDRHCCRFRARCPPRSAGQRQGGEGGVDRVIARRARQRQRRSASSIGAIGGRAPCAGSPPWRGSAPPASG